VKAVLLSIKPEFAHKIFEGSKKFEFRKQVFKDTSVKKVIVYSSSPEQKVIGEFEIEAILSDTPDNIWIQTKLYSGISQEFYDEYFKGRDNAYAIKVASTKKYRKEKSLADYNVQSAPQSFAYVEV
jgi:predicted transcriptional regulator